MRRPTSIHFSRAGDYFHYMWAAQRCLPLLSDASTLKAVVIEGVSGEEAALTPAKLASAEDIIDVAEYYGSEHPEHASSIRYSQLKHSYQRLDKAWTPSTLKDVLKGLFEKYADTQQFPGAITIHLITNRPVSERTKTLFKRLQNTPLSKGDKAAWSRLCSYVGSVDRKLIVGFLEALHLEDNFGNYRETQKRLLMDVTSISPGSEDSVTANLLSLVMNRVMPDHANSPEIRRATLLEALGTHIKNLYPAKPHINVSHDLVVRKQEAEILESLNLRPEKVLIEAAGGFGKSALTLRLDEALSASNVCITYDCFGNGEYRSVLHERFEHRNALTQIANQLAAQGLCPPLIPARSATRSDIFKAFVDRLADASVSVRMRDPEAQIYLLIDAADNAEMAAQEFNRPGSFARDLAREALPDGVTSVFFCRPSRSDKLDLPPDCVNIPLKPFCLEETAELLRLFHPTVTEADVEEFHYLTSATPRIQATTLTQNIPLNEILQGLGPSPVTVDKIIQDVFETALAKLQYELPQDDRDQIIRLCEAIAALRPFIPIDVLARASDVPVPLIVSFVSDIGRPFMQNDGAIQFYDEPSEHWFRKHYAPTVAQLSNFIDRLIPLAEQSPYVAAALPELLHRVGRDAELVKAILTDAALPSNNPLDKRHITIQRLRFALKSAISDFRYTDAAQLAFKLAGEVAGEERQTKLIQSNTHLFGNTMASEAVREYVAQDTFTTEWHGGQFVYSASLLSWNPAMRGEARAHTRVALGALDNWAAMARAKKERDSFNLPKVSIEDAGALAEAILNIDGAQAFAIHVDLWRDKSRAFDIAAHVFHRLARLGKLEAIGAICEASDRHPAVLLAGVSALIANHRRPSRLIAQHILKLWRVLRLAPKSHGGYGNEDVACRAAVATTLTVAHYGLVPDATLISELETRGPTPTSYAEIAGLTPSYTRRCAASAVQQRMAGEKASVTSLMTGDILVAWRDDPPRTTSHGRDLQFFQFVETHLMPWCDLRARLLLKQISANDTLNQLLELSAAIQPPSHNIPNNCNGFQGKLANLWIDTLAWCQNDISIDESHVVAFKDWVRSNHDKMYTPDLFHIARLSGRIRGLVDFAFEVAGWIEPMMRGGNLEEEGAENLVDSFQATAEALFEGSREEANIYLDQAAGVAAGVGMENINRLACLVNLANGAARMTGHHHELANRFARVAEYSYGFLARDKYWQRYEIVEAIGRLSPSSAFSILARWKDRRFNNDSRLLTSGIESLLKAKSLPAEDALTLIAYDFGWPLAEMIGACRDALQANDNANREIATYVRLTSHSNPDGAIVSIPSELPQLPQPPNQYQKERARYTPRSEQSESKPDIETLKSGLNLNSQDGLLELQSRLSAKKHHDNGELFARIAFADIDPKGRIGRFNAVINSPIFTKFSARYILLEIPEIWFVSQYFCEHLKSCILAYTAENVPLLDYYGFGYFSEFTSLPFDMLEEKIGLNRKVILKEAIKARQSHIQDADSGDLFTLVNMLAEVLSGHDAQEALSFGLRAIESQISEDFGDGQYQHSLAPPDDVSESLAGYIWSGLSLPHRPDRWESMHAAALAIVTGREKIVKTMCDYFRGSTQAAFHAADFDVRTLSAKIAFLHVVRRAIIKSWAISEPIIDVLQIACEIGETHVLIRSLAANCLLDLHTKGLISLDASEHDRLSNINAFSGCVPANGYTANNGDPEDKHIYFGHDMDSWVDAFQRALGLERKSARQALKLETLTRFGYTEEQRWKRDCRSVAQVYRNRSTWDRKCQLPTAEDMDFYVTVHAAFHLAGEVIDADTSTLCPKATKDVADWLSSFLPTDEAGYWLFDWRDPDLDHAPDWGDDIEYSEWSHSLEKTAFTDQILSADGSLRVNGNFSLHKNSPDRTLNYYISSAFVSAGPKAFTLQNALQTIDDFDDFRLPSGGDEYAEVDQGSYVLKGWLNDINAEKRIDAADPWAGQISIPSLSPADWFIEHFRLSHDQQCRSWTDALNQPMLKITRWGAGEEENGYSTPDHGELITIPINQLKKILRSLDRYLILSIRVRRSSSSSSRSSIPDDEYIRTVASELVILVDHEGNLHHA